jgi:hypothetical protein
MLINVRTILVLVAVACFGAAAAGVPSRVNLLALGLAVWALSTIITV